MGAVFGGRMFAARHEAGHVVIARHFGVRVGGAAVYETDVPGRWGGRTMAYLMLADPQVEALVCAAGMAATARVSGDGIELTYSTAPGDVSRIAALGCDVGRAVCAARDILDERAAELAGVAEALSLRGRLTAADLVASTSRDIRSVTFDVLTPPVRRR